MKAITACCFGGPLDRRLVAGDSHWLQVAFPPKLSMMTLDPGPIVEPITIRVRTYRLERFVFAAPEFKAQEWPAWIYDGGWIEDEKVEAHVEMAMRMLYELARVGWMRYV